MSGGRTVIRPNAERRLARPTSTAHTHDRPTLRTGLPLARCFPRRAVLPSLTTGCPLCAELRVRGTASHDPHGCKHEAESGRLGSTGETAAMPLTRPGRAVAGDPCSRSAERGAWR